MSWVEQAFQDDVMGRPHLDGNPVKQLHNISSLAFASDGILLGCLLGKSITKIHTNITGIKPAHWRSK